MASDTVWVAYYFDPMPIVSFISNDELEARRYAADHFEQVKEVALNEDIGEQLR